MKLIPSYPLPSSFAVNFETIPLDTFVLPEDLPCVAVSGLDGDCSVCLCPLDDPTEAEDGVAVRLPCGHQFHRGCSSDWLRDKGTCPYCRAIVAVRPGGCPDGRLYVSVLDQALPGQHGQPGGAAQTLVLQFSLSGGVQDQRHPHPGVSYPPDSRVHLMPACPRGVRVLRLMVRAWALRHLFTVGLSVTRGVDDVVIYGGVHMRSQRTGPHGWPAPDFFTGVEAELAQLGVVHDDEEENKS
jgi:deltex-like protein